MSAVKEVFSILAARAEEAIPVHNCDYTDEATGLLICGKCRSPKQCRPFPDSNPPESVWWIKSSPVWVLQIIFLWANQPLW